MTKQINTSIIINASKKSIWKILTDFEKYPDWNPFITSITGTLEAGQKLQVKLQGMTFEPTILTLRENSEIKWLGHLWFEGLFDGEHTFKLTDNGDGTTHFEQCENFSGVLVRLFAKSLDKDTKAGFEKMNLELKSRVEKQNA